MKRRPMFCALLVALCLAATPAAADNLLGYRLPEDRPVVGLRFLKPFFSEGDEISSMTGTWTLEANVPAANSLNVLVELPLTHYGYDYDYWIDDMVVSGSTDETAVGNIFLGVQTIWGGNREDNPGPEKVAKRSGEAAYSEIGSGEAAPGPNPEPAGDADPAGADQPEPRPDGRVDLSGRFSGLMFGVHLPTAGNDYDAMFAGLLAENTAPFKFYSDYVTPRVSAFSHTPIGETASLDACFGGLVMVPTESGGDAELFFDYRATMNVAMQSVDMLMELNGILYASGDVEDFADRFTSMLSFGMQLNRGNTRPGIFISLPVDDTFNDVLDLSLGVRCNFVLP